MFSQKLNNKSKMNITRVQKLFEAIRRDFRDRKINSHAELKQAIFQAMAEFFENAGKPSLDYKKLDPDSPRFASLYNKIINTLADDFEVAFAETKALLEAVLETFNYQAVVVKSLDYNLEKATSALLDLEIVSNHPQEAVFAAGDDFSDSSRIDTAAALANPLAELPTFQNAVVLKRSSSVNLAEDNEELTIDVGAEGTQTAGLYEGRMFALAGEAEPETGEFNFQTTTGIERLRKLDPALAKRYKDYVAGQVDAPALTPSAALEKMKAENIADFKGFTKAEWEELASSINTIAEVFQMPPQRCKMFASTWDEDTFLYDAGADEETRQNARKLMVDGNPDSYWQVEYVADAPEKLIPWGESDSDSIPPSITEDLMRATELAADARLGLDLKIHVTLDFKSPVIVNWLSLIPHIFVEGHYLKINGIETSTDGRAWELLEGWNEGKFETTLTDEVNEELTEEEKAVTLAATKFEFAGKGLWTFPPCEARFIRFRLEQQVPEVSPYNMIKGTLRRTTTHRSRHKNMIGVVTRRTKTSEETWDVLLSYPESVMLFDQGSTLAEVFRAQQEGGVYETNNAKGDAIQAGMAFAMGGLGHAVGLLVADSKRSTISDLDVAREKTVTLWDKLRYAIGIKEIGVHSHTYEETSEFVSVPFEVPRPIRKVYLHTDEIIPASFDTDHTWIEYYVSFGDSNEWHQIRPADHRRPDDVPIIINVNSELEEHDRVSTEGYINFDGPVRKFRLRAVLIRPGDDEVSTPVLKGYRLKAFVR